MSAVPGVLPPATEWLAPDGWQAIDFISDLHLSDALPRTFAAWAAYMRGTRADAVVVLGDLFEFWQGSDAVQLEFESNCIQVIRDTVRQRPVALMVGNRDFLLTPAFLRDIGVMPLADPTLLRAWGRCTLLTHGDALCLADEAYQRFRAWTRDPATQRDFLARPLAERVLLSASIRHASEAGRNQAPPEGGWADLDAAAAVACLRDCRRFDHAAWPHPSPGCLDAAPMGSNGRCSATGMSTVPHRAPKCCACALTASSG